MSRRQLLEKAWDVRSEVSDRLHTRTVDMHVRRLRAKLGPENETLIGTVRNVGYRFVLPPKESAGERQNADR
jgi:DNA-binding response OmpR family regulator